MGWLPVTCTPAVPAWPVHCTPSGLFGWPMAHSLRQFERMISFFFIFFGVKLGRLWPANQEAILITSTR